MRALFLAIVLAGAARAAAPEFRGIIDQYCTLRMGAQYCSGLNCVAQTIVGNDRGVAILEIAFKPDNLDSFLPQALMAKALAVLGAEEWDLEFISHDLQLDPLSTGAVYHLHRQIHFVTKG